MYVNILHVKINPRPFFGIIRRVLSWYYAFRWKVRYLARTLGIEHRESQANAAWRYDQERFLRFSETQHDAQWPFALANPDEVSQEHFRVILMKSCHVIEKGMALREPRQRFGQKSGIIARCIQDCEAYVRRFGYDWNTRMAFDVIQEYRDRFGQGYPPVEAFLERYRTQLVDGASTGGTQSLTSNELFASFSITPDTFFLSRHSIRDFSDAPVPKEIILTAAEYSLRGTPSPCNRQPTRLHVVSSVGEKADVLRLQNGNGGFGDQASHIVIVTSSLEAFVDIGERNECWLDGGMFAMSFIYALHAMKIGSCVLNWDVLPEIDKAMHRLAGIPESEVVVALIAVGNPSAEFRVAKSQRKEAQEIVTFR